MHRQHIRHTFRLSTLAVAFAVFAALLGVAPSPQAEPAAASPSGAAVEDFVLLAEDSILVGPNTVIDSGDVGARVDSGPLAEVRFQSGASLSGPSSTVFADQLTLDSGSSVGNAHYNSKNGTGTITGTDTTPLDLPVVSSLPAAPSATPGATDVSLTPGTSQTLAAGAYDELFAHNNTTVTLSGGTYHFTSWDLLQNVTIEADAAVDIRIADWANSDSGLVIGPSASATTLTAADIQIAVHGTEIPGPPAGAASLGGTVTAHINVPNGQLQIGGNMVGQFVGKSIRVQGGSVTYEVSQGTDTTPPAVNLDNPMAEDTIGGVVTLQATATDDVDVALVEWIAAGVVVATATAPTTGDVYEATWDTTAEANGLVGVVARASDAAGNSAESQTVGATLYNGGTVSPVTYVAFEQGVPLSDLETATVVAGFEPVVFQHVSPSQGGVFAWNQETRAAFALYRASYEDRHGPGDPAVTAVAYRGTPDTSLLGDLASDIAEEAVFPATGSVVLAAPSADSPRRIVPVPSESAQRASGTLGSGGGPVATDDWWPTSGSVISSNTSQLQVQMWWGIFPVRTVSVSQRSISQTLGWDASFDPTAWAGDYAYEHDIVMRNESRSSGTRPFCDTSTDDDFWLDVDTGWASWDHNLPADTLPYFDAVDLLGIVDPLIEDPCKTATISIGMLSPSNLPAGAQTYVVEITGEPGSVTSQLASLSAQALEGTTCFQLFVSSWCTGLNPANTVTKFLVDPDGLGMPGCYTWTRTGPDPDDNSWSLCGG